MNGVRKLCNRTGEQLLYHIISKKLLTSIIKKHWFQEKHKIKQTPQRTRVFSVGFVLFKVGSLYTGIQII